MDKLLEFHRLLAEVDIPIPWGAYIDVESEKNLDEKIRVLTELKEGKGIDDIEGFFSILELLPDDFDVAD